MSQFRILIGIGFLMILGYSAVWYTVAFDLKKNASAELSALRDLGMTADIADIELSGFPYRIILSLEDFAFSDRARNSSLHAETVEMVTHLWTPSHYVLQARGLRASLFGRSLEFRDDYARASARRDNDGAFLIAADSYQMDDFTLERAPSMVEALDLKNWQLYFRINPAPSEPQNSLYGQRFVDFRTVLEGRQVSLTATGGISGPTFINWHQSALGDWRDQGGLVTMDEIKIETGRLDLIGSGSLTLDERFRLLGSLSFDPQGVATDTERSRLTAYFKANGFSPDAGGRLSLKPGTPETLTLQNGQLILNNAEQRTLGPIIN